MAAAGLLPITAPMSAFPVVGTGNYSREAGGGVLRLQMWVEMTSLVRE